MKEFFKNQFQQVSEATSRVIFFLIEKWQIGLFTNVSFYGVRKIDPEIITTWIGRLNSTIILLIGIITIVGKSIDFYQKYLKPKA